MKRTSFRSNSPRTAPAPTPAAGSRTNPHAGTGAPRRRIAVVATVPYTFNMFLASHLPALARLHDVTLLANGSVEEFDPALRERCDFIPIGIAREVSPRSDLRTLVELRNHFRREAFDAVLTMTPKAGLLGMVSARVAGIPTRIHWFTGQVWATRRGLVRRTLRTLDGVTAGCATGLLADSPSQRAFLAHEGVAAEARVTVLGDGSVCGVDTRRFKPDRSARQAVRRRLRIDDDAVVALFLGRMNAEKGIPELASAFARIAAAFPALHLVLAGPDEGGCVGGRVGTMRSRIEPILAPFAGRVHMPGLVRDPEAFMAAADLLVLPSHREGFGLSVLEAAACGIPAIGTDIYGLTDAIVRGETGLLVPVRDEAALAEAMRTLVDDRILRDRLGTAGRARVLERFTRARLEQAFIAYMTDALGSGPVHSPA